MKLLTASKWLCKTIQGCFTKFLCSSLVLVNVTVMKTNKLLVESRLPSLLKTDKNE